MNKASKSDSLPTRTTPANGTPERRVAPRPSACRRAVCALCAFSALITSCSAHAHTAADDAPPIAEQVTVINIPSEEELRFDRVYSRMSERARAEFAVAPGDRIEFIGDLTALLSAEAQFRPDDLSLYFLIDKRHPVGADYAPRDLITLEANPLFDLNKDGMQIRPEAYAALNEMARAALDDDIRLLVSSVYRSYSYQENLFNYWVRMDGLEEAERESARAGTSQHQLGCAIDFGSITDDFDTTPMGQWVYANAARFGWSLSFPRGYEDVTGYRWECWHFRYIGREACAFQAKWFGNIQQYMLEFIQLWKEDAAQGDSGLRPE